jgi:hypothetical protein
MFPSTIPPRTSPERKVKVPSRRPIETFRLADGSMIVRRKGVALFIFGEKGDATLLGALSLESLGLTLDPIKRELKPMPLIL